MPYIATHAIIAAALLTAFASPAPAQPAAKHEITLTFDGLTGQDGAPFASTKQDRFKVVSRRSSVWLQGQKYGNPAPYIYFNADANTQVNASIRVSHFAKTFSFISVDLYSSITAIPYMFRGSLNGATVFTARGIQPMTFGAFATVQNPRPNASIDTLEITLTNGTECCSNPMGLDNIALETSGPN